MPISATKIRREHQKREVLSYLHEAQLRGVQVIGVQEQSNGHEFVTLRPEQGPSDAADPMWANLRFDLEIGHDLADSGHIEMHLPGTGSGYRFRITEKGTSAIRDAEDGLGAGQRLLLQTVFNHFQKEGEWPKWWNIGRELLDLDVVDVANQLGTNLINAYSAGDAEYNRGEHGQDAILTMPAVALCEGSDEVLADFLQALHLCLDRFFSNQHNPRLSGEDLKQQAGMSELRARKTLQLIAAEPYILGGGPGVEYGSEWWRDISPKIRRYRGVASIGEYLQKRPSLDPTTTPNLIVRGGLPVSPLSPRVVSAPPHDQLPSTPPRLQLLIADEELQGRCSDLLTAGGHYDRVVREACIVLENRVRRVTKSQADGTALMELVFSAKNPMIRLSENDHEQRGAMELYRGMMAFFRNSTGHNIVNTYSRDDAQRVVAFVDLLLGMIERTTIAEATSDTATND